MNIPPMSTDLAVVQASVLDHSAEFVELVYGRAPGEYRALLSSGRFDRHLAAGGSFNHGKLYAYAEFRVFRQEFQERFPEAADHACINAFSALFLKNDISIHNLIDFIEGTPEEEQLLLNTPES